MLEGRGLNGLRGRRFGAQLGGLCSSWVDQMLPNTPGSPQMRLRRWNFAGNAPELPQLSKRMKRGAKAMRDLRPLAENTPNQRPLTERTLDAAQDWSVNSTPRGARAGATATCGLELSEESRSHFFGHRTGLDVEAELQRQAVLLKGLLRDVAVMRDTVWHLSDELACISSAQGTDGHATNTSMCLSASRASASKAEVSQHLRTISSSFQQM